MCGFLQIIFPVIIYLFQQSAARSFFKNFVINITDWILHFSATC